ncbi:kinase-like protein [Neurospora crassa]|uniref:non-specific serine/threonine protein kinase n=1 Tax=Neurospora crassa (strain ATCC 24698 / 74-OR23-1A / CBS 708.71 / DSM 1257 / FGSC 987) TaxID=367110 RepID=A7UXD5_NEUCR|nr:cell cycle protein kinase [Neurospora crassa OR74A]EDO65431.1 cell cycle protein kinase [Neurospora crassa OR74A]KHE84169.1 kinase-like protein [Neurospora crassa]|eukprot:XP_001728522.1 cell cycle protein kinase [Neurospora crassa OR74A]
MAAVTSTRRQREEEHFRLHQDAPSTQDTEMSEEAEQQHHYGNTGRHDAHNVDEHEHDDEEEEEQRQAEEEVEASSATEGEGEQQEDQHGDEDDDQDSVSSDSSDDGIVDPNIQDDMEKLQNTFPNFRQQYRLIKRIGEGTFSTVYKAEDLVYDQYDNSWDYEQESDKWAPPPLRTYGRSSGSSMTSRPRRKPKYVAIKKIYVTSSPTRILNELDLLHDLRGCTSVCPLITAFRETDQVIAILPYFRHADFREYFRKMTPTDIAIYLRSLFTALESVHRHKILHRDIKPTNFLYDPATRRGVLVDFGLAEREGSECKPCLCHEDSTTRRNRLRTAHLNSSVPHNGYPKQDTRPSRRANRAGTRGFRAPEVLFKCTEQTTKIDIWSAGVILLTILSKRFPFFNSADDVEAMIEIATIFGIKRMRQAGQLHGCMFETTIPTIGTQGFSFERIILWSTCRDTGVKMPEDEKLAVEFLAKCMDLDPARRISAEDALNHPFLQMGLEKEHGGSQSGEEEEEGEEDEMDILRV